MEAALINMLKEMRRELHGINKSLKRIADSLEPVTVRVYEDDDSWEDTESDSRKAV